MIYWTVCHLAADCSKPVILFLSFHRRDLFDVLIHFLFQSNFLCVPFSVFCLSWLFQLSWANLSYAFSCSPYLDEDARNVLILETDSFKSHWKRKKRLQHSFVWIHHLNPRFRKSQALWTKESPNILHVKVKVLLFFPSPLCSSDCDFVFCTFSRVAMLCGSNWKYFVWSCNGSRTQGLWMCQSTRG